MPDSSNGLLWQKSNIMMSPVLVNTKMCLDTILRYWYFLLHELQPLLMKHYLLINS